MKRSLQRLIFTLSLAVTAFISSPVYADIIVNELIIEEEGLPVYPIALIVAACFIVAALAAFLIVTLVRRNKKKALGEAVKSKEPSEK
ncbi:MAG: hypothetical protein LBN26_05235 [Christensenellaceae bacterium]|jgi:hypothetical protein|nr:hypothetical protein [Christensenellaceae bacterium]